MPATGTPSLQVFGASLDERDLEAVRPSFESSWLGLGPVVESFERALGERLGAELVMVNSGTSALHLAVELLDLPPSSEVVLPSFTYVGCAHAVALAGHVPVLADVDRVTCNMGAA